MIRRNKIWLIGYRQTPTHVLMAKIGLGGDVDYGKITHSEVTSFRIYPPFNRPWRYGFPNRVTQPTYNGFRFLDDLISVPYSTSGDFHRELDSDIVTGANESSPDTSVGGEGPVNGAFSPPIAFFHPDIAEFDPTKLSARDA